MKTLLLGAILSTSAILAAAEPVFWRDPGPAASLDMAGGPGGRAKSPQAPFTFLEEEAGGTSPKVTVRDARGREWIVKFGEEVKAENFASRIVWAAGYFAEPTYFVREGVIAGAKSLGRAKAFIDEAGKFREARFELRDAALHSSTGNDKWNLTDTKLKGARELAGLKILFVLLANWDAKPENLAIMNVKGQPTYAVTDWGATMGRPAELSGRSKWNCEQYAADSQHLVDGIDNGYVVFNYQGKQGHEVLRGIKVEDVQWLMSRLGRLTNTQIGAALEASGATVEEKNCYSQAFRTRLAQLKNLPADTSIRTTTKTTTTTTTTVQKAK